MCKRKKKIAEEKTHLKKKLESKKKLTTQKMKIVVAIQRALDDTARVRVKPDGSGVDLSGARMSMNPFCEIALEVGRERERVVES